MKKIIAVLLVFIISAFSLTAMAWTVDSVDWNDIEVKVEDDTILPSEWAIEEIDKALKYGLIPILSDNPKYLDTTTREQFAEIVVNLVEKSLEKEIESEISPFKDSTNPQVVKAYSAGIVYGVGDEMFAPKQHTNREEIATMLCRAIKYIEAAKAIDITPEHKDITAFSDYREVSDWALESITTLVSNGLMKGTSDTTLEPKKECTIEESIILATRIFEKL